jgi:hypothetical protein
MSTIELRVQQSDRSQTFEELVEVVAELKDELDVKAPATRDRVGRTRTG